MVTTRGIGIQKRKWGRLGFLSHATDGKQGNTSRQSGLWSELSIICLEEVGDRGTIGGVSINQVMLFGIRPLTQEQKPRKHQS